MAAYSNAEYADILYIYGYCDGNASEARREYERRFPNRRIPDARVFSRTYRLIAETGSVKHKRTNAGAPPNYQPDVEEEIIRHFEENPGTSTGTCGQHIFNLFSSIDYALSKLFSVMDWGCINQIFHMSPHIEIKWS